MITDNLVVNGLIKVTSQAEVNTLTVDQVNDVSGEEISQLSGTTDNVQEQINALATSYEESIESSTEFKTEVANAVNSLSDEPSLNSESTLEQYVAAISLLGGKNYKGRLTASDDLDNVSDDGFYDIVSTDQPSNIPSDCGGLNACVEVFNLPEIETIYQRYHKFQGGVFTYSRRKFNGTWSDWVAYTFGVKGDKETNYRSGNVNITPANIGAAPTSHNHYNDTLNPACLEFVGSPTYGGYIDFHYGSSEADNTSRIIENVEGNLDINGVGFKSGVVTGTLSGNASTATKLQTARTIFGKSFDGSANIEGKALVYGTYNSTAANRYCYGALEIRENGLVGSAQSDFGYAPSIGFHWSGKVAATLSLHTDGIFYFRKQDGTTRATIDANVKGNIYNSTIDSSNKVDLNTTALSGYTSPLTPQYTNYMQNGPVSIVDYLLALSNAIDGICSDAMPKAGTSDISGNLIFSNSSSTTLTGTSLRGLYGVVGDNDGWRIAGGGSSNEGFLEIATCDDAVEPIYVRQYSNGGGGLAYANLARTLTLLDGSGNTSIPGELNVTGCINVTYPKAIRVRHVDGSNSDELYLNYNNPTKKVHIGNAGYGFTDNGASYNGKSSKAMRLVCYSDDSVYTEINPDGSMVLPGSVSVKGNVKGYNLIEMIASTVQNGSYTITPSNNLLIVARTISSNSNYGIWYANVSQITKIISVGSWGAIISYNGNIVFTCSEMYSLLVYQF